MNLLVTGAAGFIGSNFSEYMVDKYPNYKIIGFDKLTYAGKMENLDNVISKENFEFIKGDIIDKNLVDATIKKFNIDIIVNFAAESHVDRSIENATVFLNSNIIGTQVLMDVALKHGIKRFHQVSTDEVYGDLPLDKPNLKFTEETPLNPSSPYSASKAAADLLVKSYYRTFNLPATISRSSNNYGPYQNEEKLIPLMITKAISNEVLPVYGNGKNIRDWIYVLDHCIAIDKIITQGQIGDIYNIGGNQEIENIEVVKKILDILGKPYTLIKYVEDRKGHDLRYAIDNKKTSQKLNWSPMYSFDENLKKTINWYLGN